MAEWTKNCDDCSDSINEVHVMMSKIWREDQILQAILGCHSLVACNNCNKLKKKEYMSDHRNLDDRMRISLKFFKPLRILVISDELTSDVMCTVGSKYILC